MLKYLLAILLFCPRLCFTQPPVLHIHLVSHNEPNDNLQLPFNYARAKNNALQMAQIVSAKHAKWNLQTSDGLVLGALKDQETTGDNLFHTLASAPYNAFIEIDPRSKNSGGRNIADQWYLLDSLGANPTTHLGGCIAAVGAPYTSNDIDWIKYRNPVIGNIYHNVWQCSLLTGAGSLPPHFDDLHDFGVFKPDTINNFYHHNPTKNLWCMGTGCAPLVDSLSDEQAVIALIQGQVDSIQSGWWPADKFYVTRIMTNQREYGPLFFEKIAKVIDAVNAIGSDKVVWATMGETFTDFQNWQTQSGQDHSQWLCGETTSGVSDVLAHSSGIVIYPNPANGAIHIDFKDDRMHEVQVINLLGKTILVHTIDSNLPVILPDCPPGLYFIRTGNVQYPVVIEN